MPTRPQIWRFRAIYDGFEHGGLRAEVDRDKSTPLNRAGRVARLEGFVCDEDGRRVGQFTRMLASGGEGFRVRHEKVELDPAARGRGFARAMHQHAEDNIAGWRSCSYHARRERRLAAVAAAGL